MLASGLNDLKGIGSTVRARRSSRVSLLSDDVFSLLINFKVEKHLSSFPLETGRERRSCANNRALCYSVALGA